MTSKDAQFEDAAPDGTRPTAPGTLPAPRPKPRVLQLVPTRRSWVTRLAILTFDALVLCAILLFFGLLLMSDREVRAPSFVAEQLAERLDQGLPRAELTIDRVTLQFDRFSPPRLRLHAIRLTGADGTQDLLRVPVAEIGLRRRALLSGQVLPDALRLSGARVVVARDAEGQFDLGLGTEGGLGGTASLPDTLAGLEVLFDQPALSALQEISATDITLDLRDARAGRSWLVENGRITLSRSETELRIAAALSLPQAAPQGPGGDMLVPEAEIILTAAREGGGATVAARLEGVPARDIASQSAGLTWLQAVDAPVFGAVRAEVGADGQLGPLSAKLELGAGALHSVGQSDPLPFDSARSYVTLDPQEGRISLDDIQLRGPGLTLAGSGQAFVEGDGGLVAPDAIIAQLQAQDLRVDLPEVLSRPLTFDSAVTDVRVNLSPLRIDIGQLSLLRAGAAPLRAFAEGRAEHHDDGWHVSFDATVPEATAQDVEALWPVQLAPRSRGWVMQNVSAAQLSDFQAAVRLHPGLSPRRQLTWRFDGMELSPMQGFPAIRDGAGVASVTGPDFTITLEEGFSAAPGAGPVDLAGTSFRIPDGRPRPALAELNLAASGAVPDILALIDQPPLSLLRGVPQDIVLADQGQATVSGQLIFPLQRGIRLSDLDMSLTAELRGVQAARLVPGHVLEAEALTLRADPQLLTVNGAASLSGVPVSAVFSRPLGPAGQGAGARVEGTMQLDVDSLAVFGVQLPPGTVGGSGIAEVQVTLPDGGSPPSFVLSSDLNRVSLSLPPLGWSKPPASTGSLRVEGTLGATPSVPVLSLEAPGLSFTGGLRFDGGGDVAAVDFARVRLGGWLDAPVTLRPRGAGRAPDLTLGAGRIDLSRLPASTSGGGGGGDGAPIRLSGLRFTVSDDIALTDVSGEVTPGPNGLSGAFTGRVNGAAPIRGQVAPAQNGAGTAIRITGADAGAVLRAAGLFDRANDGELSLVLRPIPGAPGYDGALAVTNTRVTSAPGLATLLNALSIVGLLDQLSGPGLLFSAIEADFRLSNGVLQVRQGSGVGPSLGISMQGNYDLGADRLDMRGVVSPIYLLNGIGQIFTRRGEGLFGFNYAMAGPADAPQVTVNPLSVLTPGMFRDLFRAPPPTVPDQ